ncbi:MAG: ASKHA domain-containing protein [Acidimicrobiales bacterium]|nr:ASKHA domain-containing protein [Acidimicrobiales bacterium]
MTKVISGEASCSSELDKTIFDYADFFDVKLASTCFRSGECHECIVEVDSDTALVSDRTDSEGFLPEGYRLACQAYVNSGEGEIRFEPLNRKPRILTSTVANTEHEVFDPLISVRDNKVFYGDLSVDRYRGGCYGVALDLGTTTIVMELVDLESGLVCTSASVENPQSFGGSDVMSRISYSSRSDYFEELQKATVSAINRVTKKMCDEVGIRPPLIYEVVVVGNTTMRDILFGVDIQSIGQRPYKSKIETDYLEGRLATTSITSQTRAIGIRANREARLYSLPLISSHVGADTLAAAWAAGMNKSKTTEMLVDIGTNTEVVLWHDNNIFVASCPAGPAFEGGLVTHGMRAYEGAVESLKLDSTGKVSDFSVIGDRDPLGFCGSGLVDLLSELRVNQIVDQVGVFQENPKISEIKVFHDNDLIFSREDCSNLAQAKAANYCGQVILMRIAGVDPIDIENLHLAGAFANYVNLNNAMEIGLLLPIDLQRVNKIGNAALDGARQALKSEEARNEMERLISEVTHIELETIPEFFEIFVEGCLLKPMPKDLSIFDQSGERVVCESTK